MGQRSIFISAGDPSGDNACAHLVEELLGKYPDLKLIGLGGPRLKKLGQEQLVPGEQLAVLGFWEVAKQFFFFRRLMNLAVKAIKEARPSVILLADYPGFNLRLAKRIRSLGIPIVYYISPQIWAWKQNRIKQIKKLIDLMLLILPFETEIYEKHDVPYQMVGHYLLEDIPSELINSAPPDNSQIALLPGSRPQEVERMLLPMLKAIKLLQISNDNISAVIAGVRGICDYEGVIRESGVKNVTVKFGQPRQVVAGSRLVVCKSGTGTLECGLIGRPTVVMYTTGWITYQIAKRVVKLEMIALVNLVLGSKVAPELIQEEATPDRIANTVEAILSSQKRYNEMLAQFRQVSERLGGVGASNRAAEAIGEYL